MPAISSSEKTVVVKVDEILQTPILLGNHIVGKQVTVEVRDHRTLKEGQQTIFFARGWLLGEGIAVQEIGRLPIEKWTGLRDEITGMHRTIANQQLRKRIESADIVVVGKVLQTILQISKVKLAHLLSMILLGRKGPSKSNPY